MGVSATYTQLVGGRLHGQSVVDVRFDVVGADSPRLNKLLDYLVDWKPQLFGNKPGIMMIHDHLPSPQVPDKKLINFISSARDRGFGIIGAGNPDAKPIWHEYCNFFRVELTPKTRDTWIGYTVNEIRVVVEGSGDLVEPRIDENNAGADKVIEIPEKRIAPKAVLQFLKESKFLWAVSVPPVRAYVVNLMEEKDD